MELSPTLHADQYAFEHRRQRRRRSTDLTPTSFGAAAWTPASGAALQSATPQSASAPLACRLDEIDNGMLLGTLDGQLRYANRLALKELQRGRSDHSRKALSGPITHGATALGVSMSTNTRGVRALILTSALALALVGLSDSQAATKGAHMSVTVSVVAKCTISTAAILSSEAASVMCTSDARGAVSDDTNGARPAYTVKRVRGALTTYGPVSTSPRDSTGMHRETQVVTITF